MRQAWAKVGGIGLTLGLGLGAGAAIAQPAGMAGSYVGAAVDANNFEQSIYSLLGTGSAQGWVADQADTSDANAQAGQRQFQARIDVTNSPVSLRGAMVLGDSVEAVMPLLSYDVPLGDRANVYAGAGYVFVRPGMQTALGDRNGVVLSTGVEAAVTRTIVIYGDMRMQPLTQNNQDPVQFQFGLGHRF